MKKQTPQYGDRHIQNGNEKNAGKLKDEKLECCKEKFNNYNEWKKEESKWLRRFASE